MRWAVLVFGLAALLGQPTWAADADGDAAEASAELELLQAAQAAARELDYAGIYTYQQGVVMTSSRVVHLVDGTGERERIEFLDGAPREIIRHNDTIRSLLPEHETVVVERRRGDRFPALLLGDGLNVEAHYEITVMPELQRVAGRDCTPVALRPRDAYRYGYLLCVDAQTRLLLRIQTVTSGSEVVEQVAFSSLALGDIASDTVAESWDTQGWQVVETPMLSVDLASKGWRIPYPPGFEAVMQVSRPLRSQDYVNQLVISDGLAAISVFVEPYDAKRHVALGQGGIHTGVYSVVRKRIGEFWLTVLGQVPVDTLRDIVERVEYVPLAR